MLGAPGRVRLLLAEFSAGRISVSELSPTTVQRLLEHPDEGLRGEAKRLLAAAVPASRQQVLSEYGAALSLAGDMSRGRLVFEKSCAVCHRVGGLGFEVGPYIGDFHLRKKPAVLLESVLNPNRAIDANYVSYTVVTDAGRVHTGIIAQETASSITLKRGKNQTETILRQQIDEIRSNGVSLMPEGLEKDISVEQMADLIAYLRGWRFLADLVPLEE